MFDGLFKKPVQGQQAAQAAAKTPIQPRAPTPPPSAGPMSVSKDNVIGSDFQNVVDEAAIIYAGDDEQSSATKATEMLLAFLKQTGGQANTKVWFMLLDIYQATGKRDQYEKLSLLFADRFRTSPPSWEDAVGVSIGEGSSSAPGAAGANVLIIDGPANEMLGAKAKAFLVASRGAKNCKLDVSRMKMEPSTLQGVSALFEIMKELRKHKVAATLMGENHVAKWLDKKVQECKALTSPSLDDKPYWDLLLEILQWRGLMEQFDDLSLDFTITYELSGPGWEDNGVMTIETVVEVDDVNEAGSSGGVILPESVITDVSVQRLHDEIEQAIANAGEAKIDFQSVRRMDFTAAGTFMNMLVGLGVEKSGKVVMVNPSELIIALGDVLGFTQMITVTPRKR